MVDEPKQGYYLLFIDGGKRTDEQGQAEGAIGVILQEPDCGTVLATVAEKVGPVDSPHEAEYHALIRGLKLAAEEESKRLGELKGKMTYTEMTPAAREEMRKATAPVIEDVKKRAGADLVNQVLAEAAKH